MYTVRSPSPFYANHLTSKLKQRHCLSQFWVLRLTGLDTVSLNSQTRWSQVSTLSLSNPGSNREFETSPPWTLDPKSPIWTLTHFASFLFDTYPNNSSTDWVPFALLLNLRNHLKRASFALSQTWSRCFMLTLLKFIAYLLLLCIFKYYCLTFCAGAEVWIHWLLFEFE